jgi:serine/threonine protein kinase
MSSQEKRIGNYVLVEKVGKGGQATVWRGYDLSGREVAIKKLSLGSNPENKKSFEREIALLKLVQHEYLVKNLSAFQEGEHYYLVYEFCPCDLLQLLQKQPEKRFPERVVRRWVRQLTQVMVKLNSLRILHRDLKPENILLTGESIEADIRLADFGLIKQGLTTLSFVGTLEYASPEIKNCQNYSYNTDVWSLGIITFAALLGKLPIFHGTVLSFPPFTDCSREAVDFLQRCLLFDHRIRPNFNELLSHPFLLPQEPERYPVIENPVSHNSLQRENREIDYSLIRGSTETNAHNWANRERPSFNDGQRKPQIEPRRQSGLINQERINSGEMQGRFIEDSEFNYPILLEDETGITIDFSQLRIREDLENETMKVFFLCDDIFSLVNKLGENMKFLRYFVSKYFTESFKIILDKVLDNPLSAELEPVFFQMFVEKSTETCNMLNSLEDEYRNATKDDLQMYCYQIEEVINMQRDGQPELLKILRRISNEILRKINVRREEMFS